MASTIARSFWEPWPEISQLLVQLPECQGRVVEIGPGNKPFVKAQEFVDLRRPADAENFRFHQIDITTDPLPFADKSVDFIYCRHTLEDLHDPFWVCDEMSRVAKAGYLETPSPLAEACRGVDGGSPKWRGYHHHRYLIWNDNGVLTFLPKLPLIEYLDFLSVEQKLVDWLNTGPLYWNTYFLWHDSIPYNRLMRGEEFQITGQYGPTVLRGIERSLEHYQRMASSRRLDA